MAPTKPVPPIKPVLRSEDRGSFRAILEGAAADPNLGVVANRFPWQSKMAFEMLLSVAKRKKAHIRMLSGGGVEGFYDGQFAQRFRDCKDAGCPSIKLLVWQKNTKGISPALVQLAEEGIIELRISGTDAFEDQVPHFLLIGEDAFRQEATHARFTPQTVFTDESPQIPARIDFGDAVTGKVLADTFDQIWSAA
jgi:hypothetical protein